MGMKTYAMYEVMVPLDGVKEVCVESYPKLTKLMSKYELTIDDFYFIDTDLDHMVEYSLGESETESHAKGEVSAAIDEVKTEFANETDLELYPVYISSDASSSPEQINAFWATEMEFSATLANLNVHIVAWTEEG